jgi:hypothetical protein
VKFLHVKRALSPGVHDMPMKFKLSGYKEIQRLFKIVIKGQHLAGFNPQKILQ